MPSDSSTTGFLTEEELKVSPGVPSEARRRKGPVATIECLEDIPCNPCESSCNVDAIFVGEDITNIPHLDGDKCVACQTCVYICPGQAIFMVDESLPNGMATVMMAYEYNPLPEKGGRCCGPGPRRAKVGRCNGSGRQENPANGSNRHRND